MALSSFRPLHRNHISYLAFCKYPSTFNFNFLARINSQFSSFIDVRTHVNPSETAPFRTDKTQTIKSTVKRVEGKPVEEKMDNNRVSKLKQSASKNKFFSERRRKFSSGVSSVMVEDENFEKVNLNTEGKIDELKKSSRKRSKKDKLALPEVKLRIGLDMCSKNGDVISAIKLYDLAQREGFKLEKYHYSVILYLCSSAAAGVVHAAKSGRTSRSLSTPDPTGEGSKELGQFGNLGKMSSAVNDSNSQDKTLDEMLLFLKENVSDDVDHSQIRISDEMRNYSLERGLEIYQKIISEKIEMNESTLTAAARMAMALDNGDMAFDIVKQMKLLGISPKLRSYGPALSVFCNNGDLEKAFQIEQHMVEHGVLPEEPELEALLRVSVEACNGEKVYYILHKLRASVRKVSKSTADLIEKWFNTKSASRTGKRKWDEKLVKSSIDNNGGGWHGLGWLGDGKWNLTRTLINGDGFCKCCGEKLATIDLDPVETENFAESVASIARTRERGSDFDGFQKWLERYGPFGAVVDAANIGLFHQRRFRPSKVNAIVNGIRQTIPNRPLIVLHHRRINEIGKKELNDKAIIETWKKSNSLYATPTGSNDDWYWLYAAIKYKCLLITNDEMRDHLFQLLGNDFFPKWKDRRQVRFSFSDRDPVFHMPPPYSVVIQESEKGHWHIPIQSEDENSTEDSRIWICITRPTKQDTPNEREVKAVKHEKHDDTKDSPRRSENQRSIPTSAQNARRQNSLAQIMGAKKPGS